MRETKLKSTLRRLSAVAVALAFVTAFAGQAHAQSATVCDAYARSYANDESRRGQVLRHGAVGSLIGLGIGAMAGGAGVGAAIGGGIGAVGGGAKRRAVADQMYNAAYADCMAGKIR